MYGRLSDCVLGFLGGFCRGLQPNVPVLCFSRLHLQNSGQSPTPPPLELGVDALVVQLGKLHYSVREYKKALQQLQYVLSTLYELLVEGKEETSRAAGADSYPPCYLTHG